MSGRTVTIKVRLHDFTTHTRSTTLPAPTDDTRVIARLARALLGELDTSGGVRLLGVGVSGLADWIQEDLFARRRGRARPSDVEPRPPEALAAMTRVTALGARHGRRARRARPRLGVGLRARSVTVRFETAETPPGPVRTFRMDDPELGRRRRRDVDRPTRTRVSDA